MPDEDKNYGGSLVLDFGMRWCHVKTIYSLQNSYNAHTKFSQQWLNVPMFYTGLYDKKN